MTATVSVEQDGFQGLILAEPSPRITLALADLGATSVIAVAVFALAVRLFRWREE